MGPRTKLIDGRAHVFGSEKRLVIGIDEMGKGRLCSSLLYELFIGVFTPRLRPTFPATTKHPKPHHILQQAGCAIHSAFVAEIHLQRIE